jgi:hypothetical protein
MESSHGPGLLDLSYLIKHDGQSLTLWPTILISLHHTFFTILSIRNSSFSKMAIQSNVYRSVDDYLPNTQETDPQPSQDNPQIINSETSKDPPKSDNLSGNDTESNYNSPREFFHCRTPRSAKYSSEAES